MLSKYKIILGSKSPRRQELMRGLNYDFEIRVKDTDESYDSNMPADAVPQHLATVKANALKADLASDELLITSDTLVLVDNEILGKPTDATDAKLMLQKLSGKAHKVTTGVALTAVDKQKSFSVTTNVYFKELSEEEIDFYIEKYQPFDKAGSYGIQEWIGYIGISKIEGSYFNVMGLPVAELWEELQQF